MKVAKHTGWGSHLPVLMRLMEDTTGDVLELGTGLYSTPFLHYACMLRGRHLTSYENNLEYYNMAKGYQSDFHDVIFVEDWDKAKIKRKWDVAFIDTIPDTVRKDLALRLRTYANYVVLHDSQPRDESIYHYNEIYPRFRQRYDYKKLYPHTTVLSNFKKVDLHL